MDHLLKYQCQNEKRVGDWLKNNNQPFKLAVEPNPVSFSVVWFVKQLPVYAGETNCSVAAYGIAFADCLLTPVINLFAAAMKGNITVMFLFRSASAHKPSLVAGGTFLVERTKMSDKSF